MHWGKCRLYQLFRISMFLLLGVSTLHAEPMVGPAVGSFHLNLELKLRNKALGIKAIYPTYQCVVPSLKGTLTEQKKATFTLTHSDSTWLSIDAPQLGFGHEIPKPKTCYISLAIVALSPFGTFKTDPADVPLPEEENQEIQRSRGEAQVYSVEHPFSHGLQVVLKGSRVGMDSSDLRDMLNDTDLASKIELRWNHSKHLLSISCDEDGCKGDLL